MSLKTDADGRRYVEVEVEVPGSPETVWAAIATGPGISSWFMPARVEGKAGGKIVMDFGPGLEDTSLIKSWNPIENFSAESFPFGPEGPPVATEWIVEPKGGGTCTVRVVHSLFLEEDDWDNQLESIESGWPWFFSILRLYLERFPGQPSALARISAFSNLSPTEAWTEFTEALALTEADDRSWVSPDGTLELAIETIDSVKEHGMLAETSKPAPGVASFFVQPLGNQVLLSASLYLYGEEGVAQAPQVEAKLQSWLSERFTLEGTSK